MVKRKPLVSIAEFERSGHCLFWFDRTVNNIIGRIPL